MPEVLITTPESLHILLAQKNIPKRFKSLTSVVVDEWHELIGSKRGIQTELGISRLKGMNPGSIFGVYQLPLAILKRLPMSFTESIPILRNR